MKERNILVVGATRGLGSSLAHQYVKDGKVVYATSRHEAPKSHTPGMTWIPKIDITEQNVGNKIAFHWGQEAIDVLIVCANVFTKEDSLDDLDYNKQLKMYEINAIGPLFLIRDLLRTKLLKKDSRIVLVGSESGSISLRSAQQEGSNYGAHGSKAALNMAGKLLSMELAPHGIAVGMVHTGYLRRQNKDGFYEDEENNAVKPDHAAQALRDWIHTFDMSKTGQFWSVVGARGIRSLERQDSDSNHQQLPW